MSSKPLSPSADVSTIKNTVIERVKALTQYKDLDKVESISNEAIRQLSVPILGKLEIGTASLISFEKGKPMVTIKKGFAAVGEFSIDQLMKEEYAGKLKAQGNNPRRMESQRGYM